jgi:hypothetical protein
MASFNIHPNSELQTLFRSQPWQGQDPGKAKILIVAHDANYAENVNITEISEYHRDGVGFWKRDGVHHPFLRDYQGSGSLFHQTFAKIGPDSSFAEYISFVELLHYPTIGSIGGKMVEYDRSHFQWLEHMILQTSVTFVLGGRALRGLTGRQSRRWGCFGWLKRHPVSKDGSLNIHYRASSSTILSHYHYSCRQHAAAWRILNNEQIPDIRRVIHRVVGTQ